MGTRTKHQELEDEIGVLRGEVRGIMQNQDTIQSQLDGVHDRLEKVDAMEAKINTMEALLVKNEVLGSCSWEDMCTLTHHKKSVRALALHPKEKSFASASADNIKKFSLPKGEFLHNMLSQQKTILNAMAVNEDGVLATVGKYYNKGTMEACGSRTGRVAIISSKNRLLSSLDHWRVRLVYMPCPTTTADRGS